LNSRSVEDLLSGGMLDASTKYSRSGSSAAIDFQGDLIRPRCTAASQPMTEPRTRAYGRILARPESRGGVCA
jgi:hypothetical protein